MLVAAAGCRVVVELAVLAEMGLVCWEAPAEVEVGPEVVLGFAGPQQLVVAGGRAVS